MEVAVIADFQGKGYEFARGVYEYLKTKGLATSFVGIEKSVFKDKEFKVRISENIRRKKCFFIHDGNKEPSEWFAELLFVLEALSFSSPEEINIILPYMRFTRQDRKESSRVSVNAKVVAEVISLYADRGMTVDLHAPQIQEYFNIPFDNLYSSPNLIEYLKQNYPEILKELVIVGTDLGGGKRVEALAKMLAEKGIKAEIALGYKTREKDNEVARTMVIGEVKDKNCLIVDDIIDTGNTMIKTAEVLKKNGAKKVYAYGTHGLFTEGYEKFNVFDKVFVSDTLKNNGVEVVSLVGLFGEAIYRTVVGESLSSLFDVAKNEGQKQLKI